jgi:hypothetical protein
MSWSYSADPSTSPLDEVRFWCQDVKESRQLLSDEEIEYLLEKWYVQSGSVVWVASVACEVIAAKMTPEVNASADGVSVNIGELQQRYINLAQRLRDQSRAEMDDEVTFPSEALWSQADDPRIEPLVFGVGFMDNYEVGRADFGAYSPGDAQPQYPDELKPKPIEEFQ